MTGPKAVRWTSKVSDPAGVLSAALGTHVFVLEMMLIATHWPRSS